MFWPLRLRAKQLPWLPIGARDSPQCLSLMHVSAAYAKRQSCPICILSSIPILSFLRPVPFGGRGLADFLEFLLKELMYLAGWLATKHLTT